MAIDTIGNLSQFEEAARKGKAYLASTGIVAVAAGSYLKYVFTNPTGSGVVCWLYERDFYNNIATAQTPAQASFIITPTPITSPTSVTPALINSAGTAAAATFNWKMETSVLAGTAAAGVILTTGGGPLSITIPRAVRPGESFGYYIAGSGGGLAAATNASMDILWYEEAL